MKIKKGFILRQMLKEYVVVAVGEAGKAFNGAIWLNESSAWCWEQMKEDISKEELIDRMCVNFEGLDRATAEADLEEFLNTVSFAIEA